MNIKKLANEQAEFRLGNLWDQKIDADTETCHVVTTKTLEVKGKWSKWLPDLKHMLEIDPSLRLPCVRSDNQPSQTAFTDGEKNVYQFCKQRSVGDLNTGMFNHEWLYKGETPHSAGGRKKDMDWDSYKAPFEKKTPIVFWRGQGTGGGYKDYDMQNLRNLGYTKEQRKILGRRSHFVKYFRETPHSSVDIKITGGKSKVRFDEYIKLALGKYKYMLYLEGNDLGSNVWWTYMPNCVVLRQEVVRCVCVYDLYLEPWVHYVPIDPIHPEDILDKINWCEKNTGKCLDIITRANYIHELIMNSELRHETYKIMANKIKNNLII